MENNNRQGCRWTKALDFLNKLKDLIKRYHKQTGETGVGNHVTNEINEYLATIEPCATSSWQLCPKCNGDGNLSRYNSPNLSTTTHPICDVCMGSKIIATPSPIGRDCEELKERISELELFLKDHEQWEADFIGEDSMWWPQRKRDLLAGKLYDSFIKLQEKRNQLLNKRP